MDEIITEKNYPIRNIWLFKRIFATLIILLICLFIYINIGNGAKLLTNMVFEFFFIFALAFCIPIIINILQRSYFHYSLDQHFIVLHQGIISKQNRNVPYGRIQGVFVNQGLFDRIFGLASLTIEDFSNGGKSAMDMDGNVGSGKSKIETLGFIGSKIHIPGLKKEDAEALKEIILQKIKMNPIEDSQSGL